MRNQLPTSLNGIEQYIISQDESHVVFSIPRGAVKYDVDLIVAQYPNTTITYERGNPNERVEIIF